MMRETIARYEIKSELGRGGMAIVYLAYDPNFRRNVAIKLVSVNLQDNPVFKERFEREAQLIARIEHPAIVPVYDFGEQDNQPYLVMRYMPGGTLTNKIKEGALSLSKASHVILEIAPALDAVHSQGVVHRDLKPGNILFDSFGNPAISDFGIAHFTAATTDLTGSAIIGTPTYMSPEQVRGDENLDGRSDIYALGVILFEMLTGRGPFHAATPMSVALKHITEPIPSIRIFRPDVPIEVELILNKAMAKDRENRHASASDLALDLRAIVDTFRENETPASNPVILPYDEGISTEIDMGEASKPETHPPSASQLEVSQDPNTDRSHNFRVTSATHQGSIGQATKPATQVKRSSWGILQIAAIAGLGLILLFLCASVGLFGTWAGLGLPSLFPAQSQTVNPALTPTPTRNIQDIVLFSDDFSNPLSGWPTIQNDRGGYRYQSDGYHIFVNDIDAVFWAKTSRKDDNVSIYVDAKPLVESMYSYYGLLCRMQDDQNFYYFVIRSNGDYTIGKYKNAEFQSFFLQGWRRSNVIKQGAQTNRLEADCAANTLRFYVNNKLLDEATDADFSSGFSGMIAAAQEPQGFEVVFNNFLITQAGQ